MVGWYFPWDPWQGCRWDHGLMMRGPAGRWALCHPIPLFASCLSCLQLCPSLYSLWLATVVRRSQRQFPSKARIKGSIWCGLLPSPSPFHYWLKTLDTKTLPWRLGSPYKHFPGESTGPSVGGSRDCSCICHNPQFAVSFSGLVPVGHISSWFT